MIKYYLAKQHVTLKIYNEVGDNPETIVITDGVYKGRIYASLLLDNAHILLEGDEIHVLSKNVGITIIETLSIKDRIAQILNNDSIYLSGINAVPEGREREVLEQLIETP